MHRRIKQLVFVALLGVVMAPATSEAQVLRKIKRAVKGSVEGRKAAVEDSLATLAASPVDTGLARATQPLTAAAAKAAERLAKAVAGIGPEDGRVKAEAARIEEELDAGQAGLAGLVFLPGAEFLDEGSAVTLEALRIVLSGRGGEMLLRGRATREESLGDPVQLAKLRAEAVRSWLVEHGVAEERMRTVGSIAKELAGHAVVTLVPLQ